MNEIDNQIMDARAQPHNWSALIGRNQDRYVPYREYKTYMQSTTKYRRYDHENRLQKITQSGKI